MIALAIIAALLIGPIVVVLGLAWLMGVKPGDGDDDFRSGNRPFRPI